MAAVETLLARLQNVRKTGPDGWRADCPNPVHEHGRGMLAITLVGDGRLLLHCFGCSDTQGILAAIGLELADLCPERIKDPSPEARQRAREELRRSGWRAALGVLSREATVLRVCAGVLRHHEPLPGDFDERLSAAAQRIDDARQVLS